jgi:prolyl oligopeptidase
VLIDPNTLSEDGSTSVGFVVPSWDGKLVAYSLRENNADEAILYVMDLATGTTSSTDVIKGIKYGVPSWKPDSSGFFYTKLPVDPDIPIADRPGYAHIRYHELGTDPANDPIIREHTGDPTLFVGVDLSYDGRYLFYYQYKGWTASNVYVKDLKASEPKWLTLVEGQPFQYSVIAWEGRFYIFTNQDAPRWKVMAADAMENDRSKWVEIVPQPPQGSVLDDVSLVGGKLGAKYLTDVKGDLRIWGLDGTLQRDLELPGVGAVGSFVGHPEDDEAYFSFQSFTVPPTIYGTRVSSGKTDVFFQLEVPVDPSPYKVEQVFYESRDGTKVPMFVVTRKDIALDGSTPFILYGYGGFNVTLQPWFRSSIYPWLEAGGGYAIANLRGGGEYGEEWHEAGMFEKKQNVFDDFISAAEHLVAKGYTSPERLGIRGGSNGGLLVGAAMTQRPDLFRAVACSVPLLDMVRYHLFGSGKTWMTEYGNPDKPEDFAYLHAYSPYHRVTKGTQYPALLMLSADSDDRVDPMHARKFTAAIQHATASDHPAILRIERNAGHGGADLVKKSVAKDADIFAFFMRELGLE